MGPYCPKHSFSLHFNMPYSIQKKYFHRNTRSDTLLNSPKIFFLSVHASRRQGPSFHHRIQKHLLCSLPLCPGNSFFSTFSSCHSDTIPLIFRIGIIIITVRESDEREREHSLQSHATLHYSFITSKRKEKETNSGETRYYRRRHYAHFFHSIFTRSGKENCFSLQIRQASKYNKRETGLVFVSRVVSLALLSSL